MLKINESTGSDIKKIILDSIREIIDGMSAILESDNLDQKIRASINQYKINILGRLKEKELKIAVGGETSAGKTTFLNSLFQTNMFFVTQEEATGVPTEIRRDKILKIEVIDKQGKCRETLESQTDWFDNSSLLKDEFIEKVSNFIAKYTRIGQSSLSWVNKVKVSLPVDDFPKNLVLIDTPGFNAHQSRSVIAKEVISNSHACIFIIDARNALKSKEMEVLSSTREEVGKTFLVLNKMDLVIGDDDLDCDGADSANKLIEHVEKEVLNYFKLDQFYIYPVCSLGKSDVNSDVYQYIENLENFRNQFIKETMIRKLILLLDSAAKEAIITSDSVTEMIKEILSVYKEKLEEIEKARPADLKSLESDIMKKINEQLKSEQNKYLNKIEDIIEDELKKCDLYFRDWLNNQSSKKDLEKNSPIKANEIMNTGLQTIERLKINELKSITNNISNKIVQSFRELYSNLPFKANFNSDKIIKTMGRISLINTNSLGNNMNTVNYGKEISPGQAVNLGFSMAIMFGGPLGIGIAAGAYGLGKIFGKSIEDVKSELYKVFLDNLNKLKSNVVNMCISEFNSSNSEFSRGMENAIREQIEVYREIINQSIKEHKEKYIEQQTKMDKLKNSAERIKNVAFSLNNWREEQRRQELTEKFLNELSKSSYDNSASLLTITVCQSGNFDYKTLTEAVRASISGTQILLMPGIYEEKLILNKELEIIGNGSSKEIVIINTNDSCIEITGNYIQIKGITIKSTIDNNYKSNCFSLSITNGNLFIENCNLIFESSSDKNLKNSGALLINGNKTNAVIRNCKIYDSKKVGIKILDNLNSIIEECEIYNNEGTGINISNSITTIRNSKIFNQVTAIDLDSNSKVNIEECNLFGNKIGIFVKSSQLKLLASKIYENNKSLEFYEHSKAQVEKSFFYSNLEGITIEEGSELVFFESDMKDTINRVEKIVPVIKDEIFKNERKGFTLIIASIVLLTSIIIITLIIIFGKF